MTNTDLMTTDQLRKRLEKVWLQHIKLCQDNFLYFVKNVWPDFICRTDSDPDKWGHHQHIAHEFTKIAKEANALQQRMESLYEDMGHILGRYYDLDEAMDKVDPSKVEPEDDFKDRDDKDIDNDGDTDKSDEYLHKKLGTVAKKDESVKPKRLSDIGGVVGIPALGDFVKGK